MTGKVFKNAGAKSPLCLFTGLQRFGKDGASIEVSSSELDFVQLGDVVLELADGNRWNFAVEKHDGATHVEGRIWSIPR